ALVHAQDLHGSALQRRQAAVRALGIAEAQPVGPTAAAGHLAGALVRLAPAARLRRARRRQAQLAGQVAGQAEAQRDQGGNAQLLHSRSSGAFGVGMLASASRCWSRISGSSSSVGGWRAMASIWRTASAISCRSHTADLPGSAAGGVPGLTDQPRDATGAPGPGPAGSTVLHVGGPERQKLLAERVAGVAAPDVLGQLLVLA